MSFQSKKIACDVTFKLLTGCTRNFRITMPMDSTVGMLVFKLRRYLKINPAESIYLFFQVGCLGGARLYGVSKLLSEISRESGYDVLPIQILRENTFG